MKKILMLLVMSSLLLVGCNSDYEPVHIDQIRCYLDSEGLEGKLQYYDGTKWIDYDSNDPSKIYVYYTIDVKMGGSLDIEFDIYSPDLKIDDMKITTSTDFVSKTNVTKWAVIKERKDKIVQSSYLLEVVDGSFNVIKVYGWLTDNGPKYLGSKRKNTNYVISGIHLNVLPK